jgi:phosphohistidine phosphatase SixA
MRRMRVYLMRHSGSAKSAEPDLATNSTRRNKAMLRAAGAARGLAALGVLPDLLLTSPDPWAVYCAETAARQLGMPESRIQRTDALLQESDPAQLAKELSGLEAEHVLCLGHAGHLDDVIGRLIGAGRCATALRKAAVACLELPSGGAGQGVLLWLYPQKILRRLAR